MSSVLGAGNLVQLVWSTSNWGYQNNNLDISLVNIGETILDTTTTSFGGSFNAGTSFYTNDDVNGLNINPNIEAPIIFKKFLLTIFIYLIFFSKLIY